MRKIDDRLIEWFTDAYLWLLDWTGVYVATVGMFFVAMDVGLKAVSKGQFAWYDALYFAVMSLVWFGPSWMRQHMGLLTLINVAALQWREFGGRRAMVVCGVMLLLDSALRMRSPAMACSDLMTLSWFYLTCVTVRDREPREFRLGRALRPMTGGAS